MTSPITIRCLGPMQVESGSELWLPKGKPAHLLALLVVHRRMMVRVDTLIDELWLGEPVAKAETAFRVYVGEIRKRIGFDGLIHEDRFVRLAPSLLIDIDEFTLLVEKEIGRASCRERV